MVGNGISFLVAFALVADPPRLQAGDGASLQLQISAPAEAAISLWASAGTVSAPIAAGPGRWSARYAAGPERFPRVALLLATAQIAGRVERAWLAVPIDGRDTLDLTTKSSSRVEVEIAGATFGPVRSDRAGRARVPVVVPPGISTAAVRVRDEFGNEKETTFDLRPPPFQRMRMVASGDSASASDPDPITLELFAVDARGGPARRADLLVTADRGTLGALEKRAPGLFSISWRAPEQAEAGEARVQARLAGSPAAQELGIAIRPGAPRPAPVDPAPSAIALAGGSPRLSAGAWLVAQHNLSRARSAGVELEVAGSFGLPWLEAYARLSGLQYAPVTTPIDDGAVQRASLQGLGLSAGARLVLPLQGPWSLHASAAVGALRALGTLRVEGGAANGVSEPTARWAPEFAVGAGGGLRLGPGRLMAEAQLAAVPAAGMVQGNLGGLRLHAGWLMSVR